jgi:two-component system, NarL family, sensor histidine kinase UhpB
VAALKVMESRAASTGYIAAMADRVESTSQSAGGFARAMERLSTRYRRTSLYVRVVAINAAIVAAATLVLAVTPATVGYPIQLQEAIVLVVGVLIVAVANALVLRISFGALASVVARMKTADLLQPRERLPEVGGSEMRAVVAGFNQMLARLEADRRESSRRTLAALEGERRRIAQELHDEIGQRLTGMLLQLGNLVPDAPSGLRERVSAIQEDTRATLDQVGLLAWQLRPGILDDLGLLRALEALVESFEEQARIRVQSSLPARLASITPDAELAVYRIVQEALTNAVRHSGVRQIDLMIAVREQRLSVSVSDDGVGLSPGEDEGGAGIRGMRERALSVGGTLAIDSGPRAGVRVSLELPLATDIP